MDDRELYQVILGLSAPWTVERVELKEADQAVEVWVGEREGTRFTCPECGERSPIYDRLTTAPSAGGGIWTPASSRPPSVPGCRGSSAPRTA